MANQIISLSANHDELTGRLAGEDITIQLGAKLTIDSMPHLTPSGILGDINITSGEVHIDGRYVRSELQTIMDVQAGNWEIQETMMIFYKRDGTELFRYSLLDQNGLPSNKDVFKRLKL